MRRLAATLTLVLAMAAVGQDKDAKPLTPEEAAKKNNEKVTLEMEVKSTGLSKTNGVSFLNSEANFRDAKNFTIVIRKEVAEKYKKDKVDDVQAHFKGKTIRVTGKVTLRMEKPQIVIDEPGQIQLVEKK